jgi:cob(I)alamin adenosyltransferase
MSREDHESLDPEQHKQRMQALKARHEEELRDKNVKRGVIVVNTGDGKGKSSSAFGVAIRAAGHGQRVGLVQFIKGTWKTGEQAAIKRFPEIDHVVSGDGFTWDTQDREHDVQSARAGWDAARGMLERGDAFGKPYDVVILDELNNAISYGYLPLEEIVSVLSAKPRDLSIVVTGRDAKAELIAIADTVTEMRVVKHAWDAGIKARRGVEF